LDVKEILQDMCIELPGSRTIEIATLMNLFGLDPQRLTFKRTGREQSLLDGQPGKVVSGILQGG
jgi:hypothetical protein